jgi:hypothetical protein
MLDTKPSGPGRIDASRLATWPNTYASAADPDVKGVGPVGPTLTTA